MKRELLAVAFLLMASCLAKAQTPASNSVVTKPKTFVIKLQATKKNTYGFLSGINDSTMKISFKRTAFSDGVIEKPYDTSYLYSEIEKVGVRKYGSVRKGIIIGGLVGAAFGSLLEPVVANDLTFGSFYGANTTSDGSSGHILTGLITGLITGVIIGGLVGSEMLKFNVQRNKEKFRDMKSKILEMTLPKPKDSSYTDHESASF